MLRFAVAAALLISVVPTAQAWCESNCRSLCAKTSKNAASCIAQHNCAQYAGFKCASAQKVNERASNYNAGMRIPADTPRR